MAAKKSTSSAKSTKAKAAKLMDPSAAATRVRVTHSVRSPYVGAAVPGTDAVLSRGESVAAPASVREAIEAAFEAGALPADLRDHLSIEDEEDS